MTAAAVGAAASDGASSAGEGSGKVVIGETADRVRKAANALGAEHFEASPEALAKGARSIWRENRAWLEDAVKQGKKIIDIGRDPGRPDRGRFYRAEQLLLKRLRVHQ